jgi:hypothetical protein
MKYIILPIFYLIYSIGWFVFSYLGCVIEFIITLKTSKPKYKLKWWWNGNQTLTNVEFKSPLEYFVLTIKNLYKI